MSKVGLFGFYGRNNTGDDAMLFGILEYLSIYKIDEVVIPMNNSTEFPKQKIKIRLIKRSYLSIMRLPLLSDIILIGGGSFFHTKNNRLKFNLMVVRVAFLIFLCKLFCKKACFVSFGFGPFENQLGKVLFKYVVKYSYYLNVRDKTSLRLINAVDSDNSKSSQSHDFAFLLKPELMKKKEKKVGINVIPYGTEYLGHSDNSSFISEWTGFIKYLLSKDYAIELFCFNSNEDMKYSDMGILKSIFDNFQSANIKLFSYTTNPTKYISAISNCSFFFTMRYHGIIYAHMARTNYLYVNYMSKCYNIASQLNTTERGIEIDQMNEIELIERFMRYEKLKINFDISNHHDEIINNSFPKGLFK